MNRQDAKDAKEKAREEKGYSFRVLCLLLNTATIP